MKRMIYWRKHGKQFLLSYQNLQSRIPISYMENWTINCYHVLGYPSQDKLFSIFCQMGKRGICSACVRQDLMTSMDGAEVYGVLCGLRRLMASILSHQYQKGQCKVELMGADGRCWVYRIWHSSVAMWRLRWEGRWG